MEVHLDDDMVIMIALFALAVAALAFFTAVFVAAAVFESLESLKEDLKEMREEFIQRLDSAFEQAWGLRRCGSIAGGIFPAAGPRR